jgi:hypothetical protein
MNKQLLAPNGKPSNLNAIQYDLVRTPAFKSWFGDWENNPAEASKVVDENGEPLVVFHGRSSYFTEFSDKYAGKYTTDSGKLGFFFTDSFELAFDFTRNKWANEKSKQRKNANIIECFLNIKNPELLEGRRFTMLHNPLEFKEYLISEGNDGINIVPMEKDDLDSWIRIFGTIGIKEFMFNQYVAFYPNQIKLADGTNTTFDLENNDIRFQNGGNVAYHGSPILKEKNKLTPSKSGELGEGIYFTRDFKYAENYSLPRGELKNIFDEQKKGAVATLILSKLKLKKISKEEYLNKRSEFYDLEQKLNNGNWNLEIANNAERKLIIYFETLGYDGLELTDEPQGVIFTKSLNKLNYEDDIKFNRGGQAKGDCYVVSGQIVIRGIVDKNIKFKGTPYLVHAVVQHSKIKGLEFSHAFIEDDENVYDYSNGREIVMPKEIYYFFGKINTQDKDKYRKYTFREAKEKMYSTGNYGCWDIKSKYAKGGDLSESSNTDKARAVVKKELGKIKFLECDGATRVLHYVLDKEKIKHVIKKGIVTFGEQEIPLHFWIELPDGNIVDYKSRMWLGNQAQEGIFKPNSKTKYIGKPFNLKMSETVYRILTMESGGALSSTPNYLKMFLGN